MEKLQSVNGVTGKETIYVDVDDEITAIIDKVAAAKGKVVALVLPKRCSVLQSVVNMKLLKRTAEGAGKNLVLVTTEAGLMPLAGNIGLYVARTPTSKPAIPGVDKVADDEDDTNESIKVVDGNDTEGDFDTKAAGGKTLGELAETVPEDDDLDGSVDLSDDDEPATPVSGDGKPPKVRKNKKLKVPNFDSFRKKALLGGFVLVLLVVGGVFAFAVLPSAAITIKTDSSTIPTNLTLVLDTAATKLDADNRQVPAIAGSQQKSASQTAQATGQQNNGDKAAGSVTVTNCTTDNSAVSLPAGSSISAGGHAYILNSSVNIMFSGVHAHGSCQPGGSASDTVDITALKPGSAYNTSGSSTSFTSSSAGNTVTITGGADGGTDDITTIVQQSDIDGATSKLAAADTTSIKQQLVSGLQAKGLEPIPATFLAGTPQVSASAKAGDAANSVTVTSATTYTMLGVQKTDLQTLVKNNVESQLDKGKQVILDDGVDNAQFNENQPGTATKATISMSTKSSAGPQLDVNTLKKQLAGKKAGDVKNYIKETPGVTDVNVKFGPFWVNSVPSKASKVTITIEKAGN